MSPKLFHQCGHNTNWNIESFRDDGCGDGLIFSPVHYSPDQLSRVDENIRRASFFDPQFYLPNSQKRKLTSYPFFPETISDGFSTGDFSSVALDAARQCVRFQEEMEFDRIVIPSRYIDQMRRNWTSTQDGYTVQPFLQAIVEQGIDRPVYLSLALTSHMIDDQEFRREILNWVTSYPAIDGVYVSLSEERNSKQSQSAVFLGNYLSFLTALRQTDLLVVAGHLNAENLLVTVVDGVDVTCGAYENTRMFSVDKFVVNTEERRGPRARMYVDGLLNWLLFSDAKQIANRAPTLWRSIFSPTNYSEEAFRLLVEPGFQSPLLYKHYFLGVSRQVDALLGVLAAERRDTLRGWVRVAQEAYAEIEAMHIQLDKHGHGEHLDHWLTVL